MQITFDLGGKVRVSPRLWPGRVLPIQPGDLTKFAPYGNGVYGYQRGKGNPFTAAPPQDAAGGVLYFGNEITKEDFLALMRIMNVRGGDHDYGAFTAESKKPGKDGYLRQLRTVSTFGLRFMFGALTEGEDERFPLQQLSVAEALWSFVEHECKDWGTSFGSPKLSGKFGGDDDFMQEELSFGFTVENDYHNIYRIWSRAWLVTK